MRPIDALKAENRIKILEVSEKYSKEFKGYGNIKNDYSVGDKVLVKNKIK